MSNFRDQLPVRQLNLTLSNGEASEPFSGRSTDKRPARDS
jgi:hypothetical protein